MWGNADPWIPPLTVHAFNFIGTCFRTYVESSSHKSAPAPPAPLDMEEVEIAANFAAINAYSGPALRQPSTTTATATAMLRISQIQTKRCGKITILE